MKSILLILWANIKRRKVQTLLVALCIALAALLFSSLIGIGLGMERPFENLYAKLKASHIVMEFDKNIHNPQEIKNWFEAQEEVESVSVPRLEKGLRKKLLFKGEELINQVQFREHHGNTQNHDNLDIIIGEEKEYPHPGEIWIPNHWRNNTDFVLGDTILVPTDNGTFPLIISAIAVDAHHSNGLSDPAPAWLGPGGLAMIFPTKDLSFVTLGIRLQNPNQTEKVWARFNTQYSYQGFSTLYSLFKQVFQIVYQITGGILFVFAIFGIIITLIITSSVVNSAIKTDYKMIGILKAQGFTNRNIVSIYVLQFLLITSIAVPFGLIGGYFMTQMVFKSLIAAIGAINFEVSLLLPSIATYFAFLFAVSAITAWTSRKATQIQPVTAIRNGGPPQKSFVGSRFSIFTLRPKSNLVVFLGLRYLMSNKKRSALLLVGLLFVVFVQTLFVNATHSLSLLEENRPAWGFLDSDLVIRQNTDPGRIEEDFLKEDLEDDDRIKSLVKTDFYAASIPAKEDKAPETIIGIIFDDELEKLGVISIEGRHPVFEDEISIGVTTSKELGKEIGDTLVLFLEGQLITYNITGLYQSLGNLSRGFYARLEAITEVNPLYKLRSYHIRLAKTQSIPAYYDELLTNYGSAYTIIESRKRLGVLKGIIKGIQDVVNLVSLLFLGVLFVTVFNDTVLSIREGQRNLGIFKAIGMTPYQLQKALIVKSVIIAILAILIAMPLSLYIIPKALDTLTTASGLVEFPYVFNLNYTLLVIPVVILLTISSVWLASKRLLKIRPRILVSE